MTQEEIKQVVLSTFKQVIQDTEKTYEGTIDENTPIMGPDSPFDSVDLVTFIVAIEQVLEDDWNISVTLADDRAMSQEASPFKNIGSISSYIGILVNEQ